MNRRAEHRLAALRELDRLNREAWCGEIAEALGHRGAVGLERVRPFLEEAVLIGQATRDHRPTEKSHRVFYHITDAGRAALQAGTKDGD